MALHESPESSEAAGLRIRVYSPVSTPAAPGWSLLISANSYDGVPWPDPLVADVDVLVPEQRHTLYRQPGWWREAGRSEGVLFIGRAQEKNVVFRTEKRRNPVTGATYPWIVRSSGVVNQFYVYGVDGDFGPFFLKFARTSRTTPSCASTGTSGPSCRPPRPGSVSRHWTTGSPPGWNGRRVVAADMESPHAATTRRAQTPPAANAARHPDRTMLDPGHSSSPRPQQAAPDAA